VDFWGFGESGARRSSYAVEDFVRLVDQFMSQMGIGRAPLVGHSMGGTVCLLFAAQHPERVDKVAVISAPIVGASLRFFPRVFGYRLFGWMTYRNLWLYRRFYRLLARRYSKNAGWADMMDRDVSHTTLGAFFASIGSLRRTDLRPTLPQITAPVLAVYGARDNVIDSGQWKILQQGLPQVRTVLFPSGGHFPMLDEHARFLSHLRPFLDEATV
jgi:pimeloyl-ACP methyl ester carboxylesterase